MLCFHNTHLQSDSICWVVIWLWGRDQTEQIGFGLKWRINHWESTNPDFCVGVKPESHCRSPHQTFCVTHCRKFPLHSELALTALEMPTTMLLHFLHEELKESIVILHNHTNSNGTSQLWRSFYQYILCLCFGITAVQFVHCRQLWQLCKQHIILFLKASLCERTNLVRCSIIMTCLERQWIKPFWIKKHRTAEMIKLFTNAKISCIHPE